MSLDDNSKRKEKLEKLLKAKEKLNSISNYPTVTKEDLKLTNIEESIHEITNKESLNSRINKIASNSYEEAARTLALRKVNDQLVEVIFLFDKSGSCYGTENEVINSFKGVIEHEKNKSRKDTISTILFDDSQRIIHNRLNIEYVKDFNYIAEGGTSLYDTLVGQLERIAISQKRDIIKPKDTVVFIMTDGDDTTSCRYLHYDAKRIIKERINDGWKFILLGVNIDIEKEANRLGIPSSNATEYNPLKLENNFKAIKNVLEDVHKTGSISNEWSKPIKDNLRLDSPKTMTKKLLGDHNDK